MSILIIWEKDTGERLNNLEFQKSSMWNKCITTLPNNNIKTEQIVVYL